MNLSLILSNCLFCSLATLILIPLLRQPCTLMYKKGIPIFFIVGIIFIKLLIPYEFSFTNTLASKNVLPIISNIMHFNLIKNITIGTAFTILWISIILFILIILFRSHQKLMQLLLFIPITSNQEIIDILKTSCLQNKIRNIPRVIQLDLNTGPFITGFFHPIIVLPVNITYNEAQFIIHHELEHYIHSHIWIKACAEIITIIYWWNPIIWILRKELIRSLEVQADTNVIRDLSKEASFLYLETLINMTRQLGKKKNNNLSLSFSIKNSMMEYRILTILKKPQKLISRKSFIFYICIILLSVIICLFSFIFTFESYQVNVADVSGSFTIDAKIDYFVMKKDNSYDLYISNKYVGTLSSIPEEFLELPIYNE